MPCTTTPALELCESALALVTKEEKVRQLFREELAKHASLPFSSGCYVGWCHPDQGLPPQESAVTVAKRQSSSFFCLSAMHRSMS